MPVIRLFMFYNGGKNEPIRLWGEWALYVLRLVW